MKRKFMVLLAALVLWLTTLVATSPAEAYYQPVKCVEKMANAYTVAKKAFGKNTAINVSVGYDSCKNSLGAHHYARVRWVRATTNVEGTRMGCADGGNPWINPGAQGGHYETRFTLYFSDTFGRNFRLPRFSTPCSSDTTSSIYKRFSKRNAHVETLLYPKIHPERSPAKFRVNAEIDWRGRNDQNVSFGARMPFR